MGRLPNRSRQWEHCCVSAFSPSSLSLSVFENAELAPEEVAARLLVTPSALDELNLADAVKIVGYMKPRIIMAGAVFIREGETRQNDYMLLVLDGDISVENEMPGLHENMVVNVMGPGSLIGEMGVLDGAPRSATCTATTDVAVAVLTRSALTKLLKDEPRVAARLLLAISKRMADHLRETTRKLKTFAQMNKALQEELQVVMNNRTGLYKGRSK